MSSRDGILQHIRAGLSQSSAAGGSSTNNVPPPVPPVWPLENPSPEAMAERFTAELKEVQGEVIRCKSIEEARRQLLELMDQASWPSIGALDSPIAREVTAALPPERVAWVGADWQAAEIAKLPAGLIVAASLLADTGSCVIACGTAQQRLMCYLPPACIVIARLDQLAEHLPAAWDPIAGRCVDPSARGEIVIVTGPSRTADIEKILILGVHGPQRLVVLLLD